MKYRTSKLTHRELSLILWDMGIDGQKTVDGLHEYLVQHGDEVIKFQQYFMTEEDKKAAMNAPF